MSAKTIGHSTGDEQLQVLLVDDDEDCYQIWFEDLCILGSGPCLQSATSAAIRNLADLLKELTTITVDHSK